MSIASEKYTGGAVQIKLDGVTQASAWSDGRDANSLGNASQTVMVECEQNQKMWIQCITDTCEVWDNANRYLTFSATLLAIM